MPMPEDQSIRDVLARISERRQQNDKDAAEEAGVPIEVWREEQYLAEKQLELQAQKANVDRALISHMPPALRDMSYESFELETGALADALSRCAKWIPPYMDSLTSKEKAKTRSLGLVLSGPTGSGKTHLLAATVRALIQKDVHAMYVNLASFLVDLRRGFDGEVPEHSLEEVLHAPVLAIDDIGVQRDTSWALEMTYVLLNGRVLQRRPTLIATNLTEPQLRKRASETSGGADDMDLLMRRIYSRVCDIASPEIVTVDAPDYRMRPRK